MYDRIAIVLFLVNSKRHHVIAIVSGKTYIALCGARIKNTRHKISGIYIYVANVNFVIYHVNYMYVCIDVCTTYLFSLTTRSIMLSVSLFLPLSLFYLIAFRPTHRFHMAVCLANGLTNEFRIWI